MIDLQNQKTQAQYEMDLENYAFNYGLVQDEDGNFIQNYDPDGSKAGNLNNKFEASFM